jgi:hypothetical protein
MRHIALTALAACSFVLLSISRAEAVGSGSLRWLGQGLQCNHNHQRCCAIRPSLQVRFAQLLH